ncbi:MAG: hypothetical protein M3O62_10180 [Pseudomonadota bacterium]|nr:hypothetical protein [Pseudomonadota bacterium]
MSADSKPVVKGTSKIEAQAQPQDDAQTLEELKIYESGRWAGQPLPKPLDETKLGAEERKIFQRATARWKALADYDLAKVYSFATPAYRKTHPQKHLNSQYHNKVDRKGVDIVELKFSNEQKTEAKLRIKLKFQMFQSNMQSIEGISWETDTWVKVDGQWWYVEPK